MFTRLFKLYSFFFVFFFFFFFYWSFWNRLLSLLFSVVLFVDLSWCVSQSVSCASPPWQRSTADFECIAMTLPTRKHNHAATVQMNQMTPVFFQPLPLKSVRFCPFQNWESHSLFFVLISFIYPVLGRCSPLTNPPFLSFTFFFLSSVRGRAGHNEDYRRANIGHISEIHVSTWRFMWLLLFAKPPNSSAWLST